LATGVDEGTKVRPPSRDDTARRILASSLLTSPSSSTSTLVEWVVGWGRGETNCCEPVGGHLGALEPLVLCIVGWLEGVARVVPNATFVFVFVVVPCVLIAVVGCVVVVACVVVV